MNPSEEEMEDLEQCCSDMLCVQCGLELDANILELSDEDRCECLCHQMV